MKNLFSTSLTAALICAATFASAQDADKGAVIQFEIGNEDRGIFAPVFEPFFDNTVGEQTADGHLSWDWRVSYTPHRTNPAWFKPIHRNLFWLSDKATVRSGSSVQQALFMPDDTQRTLGFAERPHAGYLAYEERIALADPLSDHTQRLDTLALTLGVVGPLSGAEAVHKASHEVAGLTSASNWQQIESEPIVNVYYERAQRFFLLKSKARENLEFMPYGAVALGNALTYGALGGTLRVGGDLTKDHGAHRLGPLLNGNNFAQKGDYVAWSAFLGVEGRLVGRNIFLDGNSYQDSYKVDKNSAIADIQMGFELGWGATRFTVTNLWRTKEFTSQSKPDQLLKAAFSYSY